MKVNSDGNQTKQVKKRIALYWVFLFLMFLYIYLVGEMGLGDSRKMSDLADMVSKVIIFGGILLIITRIVHYKKLLKDPYRMQMEFPLQADDQKGIWHGINGVTIFKILLYPLLFVTCTAALANETAFQGSLLMLVIYVLVMFAVYKLCGKSYNKY